MRAKGDIGLGDLALAWSRLEISVDDPLRDEVARILGFAVVPEVEDRSDDRLPDAAKAKPADAAPSDKSESRGASSSLSRRKKGEQVAFRVTRNEDTVRETPSLAWLEEVEELPPAEPAAPPPADRLIRPDWARGIFAAALGERRPGRRIDITALQRLVARARPITRIPHESRDVLCHGVQVLADHSLAMAPFAEDRDHVAEQIRGLFPRGRFELAQFRGTPLREVWQKDGAPTPHEMPDTGCAILLLSSLGRGPSTRGADHATVAEWLAFRDAVSPVPVVAFVPGCVDEYPRELADAMLLVPWDRFSRASDVQRRWRARQ